MKFKIIDLTFLCIIFITIFTYFNFYSLNVDSVWILHCAKKIVTGSIMYVDMIDVNPPLIFIYSTFAVLLSKLTVLSLINSYIFFVLSLIFVSTLLCFKILKNTNKFTPLKLKYYLYLLVLILSISISYNFGEREHLLIIFILPYIMMMSYKDETHISTFLKISIAIFASLGFNLKPHFFLIFLVIESLYIVYKKDFFLIFKIESIIIISSALLYITVIYLFFSEYINFLIPFAIVTYSDAFNKSLKFLLLNYEFMLFILTISFFLLITKIRFSFSNNVILLSIVSSVVIYLIQQKGWSYHRVPFFTLCLLFLTHLSLSKQNKNSILFLLLIPFILIITYNNTKVYEFKSLKNIIKELPIKSNILIVSTDIAQGQPLLKTTQTWSSRFPSLFMLSSIIYDNDTEVKKYTFNAIFNDLLIYKPNFIIFPSKKLGFDYYDFYIKEDKRLKSFYLKYYRMSIKNDYIILTKQKEFK